MTLATKMLAALLKMQDRFVHLMSMAMQSAMPWTSEERVPNTQRDHCEPVQTTKPIVKAAMSAALRVQMDLASREAPVLVLLRSQTIRPQSHPNHPPHPHHGILRPSAVVVLGRPAPEQRSSDHRKS
jgi:hypothetical protein